MKKPLPKQHPKNYINLRPGDLNIPKLRANALLLGHPDWSPHLRNAIKIGDAILMEKWKLGEKEFNRKRK